MKYALIKNGKIDNIIVADYTNAQMISQNLGMDEAINVDLYPISIGDIYENGHFLTGNDATDIYGNILVPKGTVIKRNLSDEEKYSQLYDENQQLKQLVADLTELVLGGL